MTSLRNLKVPVASAAVLSQYELAFDIPGPRWVEPSAASVRYRPDGGRVHGVLYSGLSEREFAALGQSEGVPWTYRWVKCRVVPYIGDGACAGATAVEEETARVARGEATQSVEAFVLTKSLIGSGMPFRQTDPVDLFVPPSRSYMDLVRQGAELWNMDADYRDKLQRIPTDPVVPGISGTILQVAQRWNPK